MRFYMRQPIRIFFLVAMLLAVVFPAMGYMPEPDRIGVAEIYHFEPVSQSDPISEIKIMAPSITEWSSGRSFSWCFTSESGSPKTHVPGFMYGWFACNGNPVNYIDPTGMYGVDVHMGLVHYLAYMAGMDPYYASLMGEISQGVDTNVDTDPLGIYIRSNITGQNLTSAMHSHFPLDELERLGYVNSFTGKVTRQNSLVTAMMNHAITKGSFYLFSSRLHTYCDSWSHEGYVNSHPPVGANWPDKTYKFERWKGRDLEMANWVYIQIKQFLAQNPRYASFSPLPFPEDFVTAYLKLEDNLDKEKMLLDAGLLEYDGTRFETYKHSTPGTILSFLGL